MTITTILKSSTAISMVALLALSACGGGGGDGPDTGGMPPDNGDGMMPGDGDGDGDGDGMMPGDGDGMATEFGDRLTASPEESPEATSTADTLLSLVGTDIALAPVSAPIGLEFDANGNVGTMPLEDDKSAYVESATVQDAQGNITIVYVVDGQRTEVQFQGSDWTGFEYAKDVDGTNYYAWFALTFTGVPRVDVIPQYTGLFGWQAGRDARGYSVDGLVTPPHRLTGLGSATYEGHIVADYWRTNNPTALFFDNRGTVWGEMTLEADFSGGSISGEIDNLYIEDHGDSYQDDWMQLAATNSIQISDGTIDENRFDADWEGQDTDTSSALMYSMRDFDGSLLGEFYGPNGEEAGGVLTGERESTNQIINGRFFTRKQ